jgi:hypothetical protein
MSLLPKETPPPTDPSTFWEKLWETEPPVYPLRLDPCGPWPKVRRFTPAFLTSALLQSALILFLYTFPFALLIAWLTGRPLERPAPPEEVQIIKMKDLNIADFLPNIKPKGAAKAPGRAPKPGTHPRLGASHFDPRITIVSNPPKPDNSLLTLKNETVPPSPKPLLELKVPDVVSGGPKPLPAPPKAPDPAPEKPKVAPPPVPAPAPPPPEPAPPPKPVVNPLLVAPVTPHVTVSAELPPPPVKFAAKLPDLPAPNLEVPLPPPPPKAAPAPAEQSAATPKPASAEASKTNGKEGEESSSGGKPSPATSAGKQDPGGGPQIMALSVNPVPLKDMASIPGGVHNGQFSISPSGTLTGSPGGKPGAPPDEGEGGPGPGGDKSVAVGNGKGKPGGGGDGNPNPTAGPSVSISGPGGGSGISSGTLPPLKPQDLVYPIKPDTPKARAPTMVVSTGSFGGGGLRVFGVLHGNKIFSVYFPMPGKAWILQYCAQQTQVDEQQDSRVVMIRMPPPLTPPAAIDQFDFHRPPQEAGAENSMIILHGTVKADGTVDGLSVIEGLDPVSNAAAMLAFAKWKFKPAELAGAPVGIEILVGIP